jgi:chromosome segregation ATPase
LDELGQVNLTLSNDLASSQQQLTVNTEETVQLSNSLAAANALLADTRNSLASAEELVTNLNARIADLETQNKALDIQAESLSNNLAHLTEQIQDTRSQLAVSETNASFLQAQLKKQLAEKAELEHKFNDLAELRAQVHKIKDEMFVARRIQLMKNDNGNRKGAALLMSRNPPLNVPPPHRLATNSYDLNVEIGSDGSVKVITPGSSTNSPSVSDTNSPAASPTNSPAQ